MPYITLCLVSLVTCIVLSRKWPKWTKVLLVFAWGLGAILAYEIISPGTRFLGPNAGSWEVDSVLFACLILGMNAKYFWDLIEERQRENAKRKPGAPKMGLNFDLLDFIKPLLVSAIVFEVVAGIQHDLSRAALVGSFQNGFFWQTVFQKKR